LPYLTPTELLTSGRISDAIRGKTSKEKGQLESWPCDDPDDWFEDGEDDPYDLPGHVCVTSWIPTERIAKLQQRQGLASLGLPNLSSLIT
jgi:hypothetical protein